MRQPREGTPHRDETEKSYQELAEMREIFAASGMGSWSIYLLEGKAPTMVPDDLMRELLGIEDEDLTPEEIYDLWFSRIAPSCVQSVLDSVEKMKTVGRDENTYLWIHPFLGERYVRCGGTARKVDGGFALRGYHYDVDDMIREQKEKDRVMEEQVAVINTLSKNFRNVFAADLNDGTARVIRLSDSYKVKAVREVEEQTFPFDRVIKRWVQENVHPEDKERIEKALSIGNLRKELSVHDACTGTYRSIEDGVLHNYQYDIRKIDGSDNVVAGFQIIDSIIEEHRAQEKKQRELEEAKLREEREHAEVISSLSTIYSTIFRAELDTHHYEVLTSVALMGSVAGSSGNFDEVKEQIIEAFIEPEMREDMDEFLDFDTLGERLQKTNTVVTDYRNLEGRWMKARFIVKRRDENDQVKEVLYVARDCTDEKEKELEQKEQLANALAAAQQASKAKSTFLSSMSHDIRTPMNAIIGFTALAQSHMDDREKVQDYLNKISTSGAHLLSLINDVLDMSRIESGLVKLEEKPVHIPDLFRDLEMMIQDQVNAKKQNLCIDIKDVADEEVITDELRLNQILFNIVGNAIKFTRPGGSISIRLTERPCERRQYGHYEMSVKDSGIGMSREFQAHIFETFTREKSTTVSGIQGTGLGMAITKNIVDMMGGEIHVESEEGKGTKFTVSLNLRIADGEAKEPKIPATSAAEALITAHGTAADPSGAQIQPPKKQYDYSNKRVLLAEDNELNREIATAILEETGMQIDSVCDGDAAVAAINEAPADRYDLILMDVQMPRMDGYTATREIRTLPDNRKANIPIVAMTANAFEEDRQKAYASGMNGHIIKPVSIESIAKVLDEIFLERKL